MMTDEESYIDVRWLATPAGIDRALAPPLPMVPGLSDYAYGYTIGLRHEAIDRVKYWSEFERLIDDSDRSWFTAECEARLASARLAVAQYDEQLEEATR